MSRRVQRVHLRNAEIDKENTVLNAHEPSVRNLQQKKV